MNNYAADTAIRNDPTMLGREAYEASLKACPNYANGDPRRTWDQLSDAVKWSWSRPTQRP